MRNTARIFLCLLCLGALLISAGCASAPSAQPTLQHLDLSKPESPILSSDLPPLHAAGNEWLGFALSLTNLSPDAAKSACLQLLPPSAIPSSQLSAARILSLPIDARRAAYLRHTGLSSAPSRLPSALLPIQLETGLLRLNTLPPSDEPLRFWIDLHVPPQTPPGDYLLACNLLDKPNGKTLASLPLKLTIYNFTLPNTPTLTLAGHLDWDCLTQLYPQQFTLSHPRLLSRTDPAHAPIVKTLDQFIALARRHHLQLAIPRLQPTVKWPAGKPPLVDWRDFDSLVAPWFDKYWPLPSIDHLRDFDLPSQLQYWSAAADHFAQADWLARVPLYLNTPLHLSRFLALHPQLQIRLSATADQCPARSNRLHLLAPSLISTLGSPVSPSSWLQTDAFPALGASEQDVRLIAFLAYLRQADFILCDNLLPPIADPRQSLDPAQLICFYPGNWFGLDEPLPTLHLKWLRRAQQDYEYLALARQRNQSDTASRLAHLLVKPIDLRPDQTPDPLYTLLSGAADPAAWRDALHLLACTILLHQSNQTPTPLQQRELTLQTLQWTQPQQQPLLLPRSLQWSIQPDARHLKLQLGLDIYSTSLPDAAVSNALQWAALPSAWQTSTQPQSIGPLLPFQVQRAFLNARIDLDKLDARCRQPVTVNFLSGYTQFASPLEMTIPIAASEYRPFPPLLDGLLNDWQAADALHEGPLTCMLDRPAIQRRRLQPASTATALYSAWTDADFHLAFKADGLSTSPLLATRNFVDYQSRRAWGEDLAEILLQPLYPDNTLGDVLHMVCKPNGHWIERLPRTASPANSWQPLEGANIRYAATIDGTIWRGEISIPWKALLDPARPRPAFLRFNFIQHQTAHSQSASWAAPLDFGRDTSFMGLLHLRPKPMP